MQEIFVHAHNIIRQCAYTHGCDMINLSLTFNPYDSKDYGVYPPGWTTTPIEPSNKSSQYIADLTVHCCKNASNTPIEYWGKKGSIASEPISTGANNAYKTRLDDHIQNCDQYGIKNAFYAVGLLPCLGIGYAVYKAKNLTMIKRQLICIPLKNKLQLKTV